jgi:hypothetical protein
MPFQEISMCFSPPKPPAPPPEDPALKQMREDSLAAAQNEKSENKERRLQEQSIRSGGMAGFRSLISGNKGGGGFGRGLLG